MKRKLRSPKMNSSRSYKDFRLWFGIIFIAISVFISQTLISKATSRTQVVILNRAIPQGSAIKETDLSVAQVVLPESFNAITEITTAVGMIASRDLFPGDILTQYSIADRVRSEMRLVSVPIRAGHLPALQNGQLVDIWVTPSTDGMALPGPSKLVIAQATMHTVPEFIDPGLDTAVTLLIRVSEVSQIVQAMRDGVIDIVALPDNFRSPS